MCMTISATENGMWKGTLVLSRPSIHKVTDKRSPNCHESQSELQRLHVAREVSEGASEESRDSMSQAL